jgi:hypothetical protein
MDGRFLGGPNMLTAMTEKDWMIVLRFSGLNMGAEPAGGRAGASGLDKSRQSLPVT